MKLQVETRRAPVTVIEYIFLLIEKYCRLAVSAGNFMETGFNYTKSRRIERYN